MSSVLTLQLQLSPVELSELHADLKIQERDEFSWKKLKAEGLDEDGEKEAKLTRNLNGIFLFYFYCEGGSPRLRSPGFLFWLRPWAGRGYGPCGPQLAARGAIWAAALFLNSFFRYKLHVLKYRSR